MKLEFLFVVVTVVSVLLLIEMTVLVAAVFMANGKLSELKKIAMGMSQSRETPAAQSSRLDSRGKTETAERVQTGNTNRQESMMICRNCYSAIPAGSRTCPNCSAALNGR